MNRNKSNREKALVRKMRSGDQLAFEELFDLYSGKLFQFVNNYLRITEESEEVVQDVFLKLWKYKAEIKTDEAFKSYLFKIALNNIRNYFSKKFTEEKHKQQIAIELLLHENSDADQLDYHAVISHVEKLIAKLPKKRKEIFILSRKEGLSISEIASYLKISESTVKNQLTSAISYLKEQVQSEGLAGYLFFTLFYK